MAHWLRNVSKIIVLGFLMIMVSACSASRIPQIIPYNSNDVTSSPATNSETIVLDSLNPLVNAILHKRQKVPVSIFMAAHGDCNLILSLSANGKKLRPFVLEMENGNGEIDFSAHITWYVKPQRKYENVIVALYSVEKSESSKTEIRILIKAIKREYQVVRR